MTSSTRRVFDGRFPRGDVAAIMTLLRCKLRLSREMVDDVVRARGHVEKIMCMINPYERSYFDDNRHGLSRGWWSPTSLAWESTFVNGKVQGIARWYHQNGVCSFEGFYVNDIERHARRWRQDGSLYEETEHDNTDVT